MSHCIRWSHDWLFHLQREKTGYLPTCSTPYLQKSKQQRGISPRILPWYVISKDGTLLGTPCRDATLNGTCRARRPSPTSEITLTILHIAIGMVFIAAEYYLPLYFQSAKQASPLRSGVLVLPITASEGVMGCVSGIIMLKTGRYVITEHKRVLRCNACKRYSSNRDVLQSKICLCIRDSANLRIDCYRYRELMWAGTLLMTIGIGLFIALHANSSIAQIVGFQLVEGLGSGMLFQPPLVALQAMVSQADTATATATLGFIRNIATSLGVVLGGVVFQNGT